MTHASASGKSILPVKLDTAFDTSRIFSDLQQTPIDLTGADQAGYRRLERALREEFPWSDPMRPPYPGLLAFQEDEAAVYKGRGPEITSTLEVLQGLRRRGKNAPHFIVLLGASGSGKSSLVRAGILPHLRNSGNWLLVPPFMPRLDPISELAEALAKAFEEAGVSAQFNKIQRDLLKALKSAPPEGKVLLDIARELRIKCQAKADKTLLLVIDQAEELFASGNEKNTEALLGLLRDAIEQSTGQLMVLATMRSDFLGAFQEEAFLVSPQYKDTFRYEKVTLDPLPMDRFREIILGPASIAGLSFDDDLVHQMVQDTGTRDALPLLAYTLRRMWDNESFREDNRFELHEYKALGGLEGSIRKAADEALGAEILSASEISELHAAFIPTMVRVSVEGDAVRRRAYWDELSNPARRALQPFIDNRLLVTNEDREKKKTIEVSHEALLRVWPQFVTWMDEDRDKLRLLNSLYRAAREWQENANPEFLVHRGERLTELIELVSETRFALPFDSLESRYLKACEQAQLEENQRKKAESERKLRDAENLAKAQAKSARIMRIWLLVAFVLLVGAVGTAGFGYLQRNEAIVQAEVASRATAKAKSARREAESARHKAEENLRRAEHNIGVALDEKAAGEEDPVRAHLYALEALKRIVPSWDARTNRSTFSRIFETQEALFVRAWSSAGANFSHHDKDINSVVFSPDGKTLASASDDETLRLWDVASGQLLRILEGHKDEVIGVAFSPNGKTLASASKDKTLRLWDVASGQALRILKGHQDRVMGVVFSPDGKTLASVSWDKTLRLWDVASGRGLRTIEGHEELIFGVAFSPDGKTLATASKDGTLRLWNVNSGQVFKILEGHKGVVFDVVFSPDGNTLASASGDETLRLWDVASGQTLRTLEGHRYQVLDVAFSSNGKMLASASKYESVRLWDVASGEMLQTIEGQHGGVNDIAFSPDGNTLVAASVDGALQLWEVSSRETLQALEGHQDWVDHVAFSPDGKTLASASKDKTLRLWDVASGRALGTLKGHHDSVWGVTFSPDGKVLVSASGDKTLRLWDVTSGNILRVLEGHEDLVYDIAFSPDGKTMVSASKDKTLRLWDVVSGEMLQILDGHRADVFGVAFSSDGKTLASASRDKTLRLWDVTSGQTLRTVEWQQGWVVDVAFSPDGKMLAFSSLYKIHLLDIAGGRMLQTLEGHADNVYDIAFSPDGKTLVSASKDKTLRLWDVVSGEMLQILDVNRADVSGVAFSPDGKTLASASRDKTLRLWDVTSRQRLRILKGHHKEVFGIAFSPDGKALASASEDNTLRLWDVASGRVLRIFEGHRSSVYDVVFSPDGKILSSASADGTLRLWDVASGGLLQTLKGHKEQVFGVAFSPDGNTLVSASGDETLRLWDVASGQMLRILEGHEDGVSGVVFSPDGKTLASPSGFKTIGLWDVASGQSLRTLAGLHSGVNSVAFSPDGRTLASAYWDKTVNLWDVASGRVLWTLEGHQGSVYDVVFSPDGKFLATASEDNTLRLWDATSGTLLRTFDGHQKPVCGVVFSPDGKILASASWDKTLRLMDLSSLIHEKQRIERDLLESVKSKMGFFGYELNGMELRRAPSTLYGKEKMAQWGAHHPNHWIPAADNAVSSAMVEIGKIYERSGDNERASDWYRKATDAGSKEGKKRLLALLNWLGRKHAMLKQESTSIDWFQKYLSAGGILKGTPEAETRRYMGTSARK